MKKKGLPVLAAFVLIVIVAVIGYISNLVEKYTPTDEVMNPSEYLGVADGDEMALIMQNQLVEYKGLISNNTAYLDFGAVKNYLNDRFYWDDGANTMVYTTPVDIISISAGKKKYTVSGKAHSENYEIIKVNGSEVYIAADFVQKYTNMEYELYKEPNYMIITYQWGDVSYADVKKDDNIRFESSIKSPILTDVAKGDKVTVLEQADEWTKVMAGNGYIGYIQNKKLGEVYVESVDREFDEPVYISLKKDHKINLVWHQITNFDSNYNILNDIADMKGVNTISPTWFSISDNEGNISSLASEDYVTAAHEQDLEVWALVDNFTEGVDTTKVLASTASREKLSNQLIAAAIQYNLDGINVDLEGIPEEAAEGYVQFVRELSVNCRKMGVVLSVDVPVPMPYTAHYNRKELGIVADYVIVMGYDEHYEDSEEAGSVASLPFVQNGIEATLAEVPAEKIISGVPFYTRLWTISTNGEISSEAKGMDTADQILAENEVKANWSTDTSQDYAEYKDAEGNTCKIWLENERSIEEKVKLVKEYKLGGVAAWKLGLERASIWDILMKYAS